jgi:hypothetical protein
MFSKTFISTVALAATFCLMSVTSDAANSILDSALQPGDMPEAARTGSPVLIDDADSLTAMGPFGVREGVDYWYQWPIDGASQVSGDELPKGWQLSGQLLDVADESGAKRLFELGKRAGGLNSSYMGEGTRILDLPQYGDEQFARVSERGRLQSLVLVRKGALVWEIVVEPMLGFQPTEEQIVAVLETYAAKQEARIAGR